MRMWWICHNDPQQAYDGKEAMMVGEWHMTDAAKTIRARIKIAIWPDGSWTAYGDHTKSAERTMDELIDAAPGGESWH